jgi:hypothetical protein
MNCSPLLTTHHLQILWHKNFEQTFILKLKTHLCQTVQKVVVVIKIRIATAKKAVAVKAVVHVKVLHQVNPEDVEKTVVVTGVKVILAVWARAIQAVKVKVEAVEAQAKIPNNSYLLHLLKSQSLLPALRGYKRKKRV